MPVSFALGQYYHAFDSELIWKFPSSFAKFLTRLLKTGSGGMLVLCHGKLAQLSGLPRARFLVLVGWVAAIYRADWSILDRVFFVEINRPNL